MVGKRGDHRSHKIDRNLPRWKKRVYEFNHKHLAWLNQTVEFLIPWLVLLLLGIIVGEFATELNHVVEAMGLHAWHWLEVFGEFIHHNHTTVVIIDEIIIAFFIMDLYFNFFTKRTVWRFAKRYVLDLVAVTPLGFIFPAGVAGVVGESQTVTHVAVETEKIGARAMKASRFTRFIRPITRLPRLVRLYRLKDLWRKK